MKKQPGYGVLLALTIAAAAAAGVTLLPVESHGKSALGYRTLCTWAPWSTLILAAAAAGLCKLRSRFFKAG